MPLPRLQLRTLMIAIAVLAPLFAVWAWLHDLNRSIQAFYGRGGPIALQNAVLPGAFDWLAGPSTGGFQLRRRPDTGRLSSWPRHPSLRLIRLDGMMSPRPWSGWRMPSPGETVLHAAQPRVPRALAICEEAYGQDNLRVANVLEHYAESLRQAGRPVDRDRLDSRAKATRSKQDRG